MDRRIHTKHTSNPWPQVTLARVHKNEIEEIVMRLMKEQEA